MAAVRLHGRAARRQVSEMRVGLVQRRPRDHKVSREVSRLESTKAFRDITGRPADRSPELIEKISIWPGVECRKKCQGSVSQLSRQLPNGQFSIGIGGHAKSLRRNRAVSNRRGNNPRVKRHVERRVEPSRGTEPSCGTSVWNLCLEPLSGTSVRNRPSCGTSARNLRMEPSCGTLVRSVAPQGHHRVHPRRAPCWSSRGDQ